MQLVYKIGHSFTLPNATKIVVLQLTVWLLCHLCQSSGTITINYNCSWSSVYHTSDITIRMISSIWGAHQDSLTFSIHNWSWIGKIIPMTFTDWGYFALAMAVHLLLTDPNSRDYIKLSVKVVWMLFSIHDQSVVTRYLNG